MGQPRAMRARAHEMGLWHSPYLAYGSAQESQELFRTIERTRGKHDCAHQGRAHGEALRHAHEGVIDGAVAVRVVLAQDLPDHARTLPAWSAQPDQASLPASASHIASARCTAARHQDCAGSKRPCLLAELSMGSESIHEMPTAACHGEEHDHACSATVHISTDTKRCMESAMRCAWHLSRSSVQG